MANHSSSTTRVGHRHVIDPIEPAECWELLATVEVARLVHVVDDQPHITVVNATVDDGTIVVRCTPGSRLATALARPDSPVLVEADHLDAASRTGWSVVVRGRMQAVLDRVETARLDRTQPPSWLLGDTGGTWLRLSADEISGRRVKPAAAS